MKQLGFSKLAFVANFGVGKMIYIEQVIRWLQSYPIYWSPEPQPASTSEQVCPTLWLRGTLYVDRLVIRLC